MSKNLVVEMKRMLNHHNKLRTDNKLQFSMEELKRGTLITILARVTWRL
jgi:hypothetical protein